jgi:hypothetical protein
MNGVTLHDMFSSETVKGYAKILDELERNFDILPERLKILLTIKKKQLEPFKLMATHIEKFQPDAIITHLKHLLVKETIVDIMRDKKQREYLNKLSRDNYQTEFLKGTKKAIFEATKETILKALKKETDKLPPDIPPDNNQGLTDEGEYLERVKRGAKDKNRGTLSKSVDSSKTSAEKNPILKDDASEVVISERRRNPGEWTLRSRRRFSSGASEGDSRSKKIGDLPCPSRSSASYALRSSVELKKKEEDKKETLNIINCKKYKVVNKFIFLEEKILIIILFLSSQIPPNNIIRNVNWGVEYGGYT